MHRITAVLVASLLLVAAAALAADYRYVSADTFKGWLEGGKQMIIVDIQPPADFGRKHFKGAVETNAFPVSSDDDKRKLDGVLKKIGATRDDIVIVCPRGGGGARNTYDYLKSRGVEETRMYILEKGAAGWPWPTLCVTGR